MSEYDQNHNDDDCKNTYNKPDDPRRCTGLGGGLCVRLFVGTGLCFGVVVYIRLLGSVCLADAGGLDIVLFAGTGMPCRLGGLDGVLRAGAVWCAPCRFLGRLICLGLGSAGVR